MKKPTAQKGFTLIELMIVIVIIGILASLAIPRFVANIHRSKQTEAQLILKQIFTNQMAQIGEHNTFGANGLSASAADPNGLIGIGIQITDGAVYTYTIAVTNGGRDFTATAAGNIDPDATLDTWTIDQDGVITHTIDDLLT